ncbi:hypothetical protein A2Z67_06390 [Candidatus Woesebacteria bacterium RBG_13_36_22]|uniref:O-antigen ligase-related domain-containing protein n=1 Tax=Candidatus Woesebacteria bacterium RBG_13_36_22 TaxID=1802478 RepID=A0A1F7WZQ7_9BACT|nr:MAG: hypothetical protein A2Z67_06390 [Candidatus Woesebacteria bacterium RBG_13_36_22]
MIFSGKIIFRKTPIDFFLITFFLSQLASTIFSVDVRTSLLGYYSRFHGGLSSSISYLFLYWAFVTNMNQAKTKRIIYFMFSSAFLVSIWAIFEHFGRSFSCFIFQDFGSFDVSCWVQDVQNRVFATFGQPNWLAAWIVALIPLTWTLALISKSKIQNVKLHIKDFKYLIWIFLSIILFITLLFTKSRSGILGFSFSLLIFWGLVYTSLLGVNKKNTGFKSIFLTLNFTLLILTAIIGTPWTPNLNQIINKDSSFVTNHQSPVTSAPALEVGGTESGQIRKIVWKGALEMWKNHPIFGTGVETFAFSYYNYRPVEHNLVSEWNFLYNKAHNEYLNFAATTGSVGLISYLVLIGSIIYLFFKQFKNQKSNSDFELCTYNLALFSGFISILVTNFFGFSVVAVAFLFFLFPAMAVSLTENNSNENVQSDKTGKLSNTQVFLIALALCCLFFALYSVSKYWYADYLYTKGKLENDSGLSAYSRNTLLKAVKYSPNESVFWDELADATSSLAIFYAEKGDMETAKKIAESAIIESNKAVSLSPASVILKKTRVRTLANLSLIDPSYMQLAKKTLVEASKLAPTDAHISYNLAITNFRTGDIETFLKILKKTIEMKPNYKEAHFALSQYYINENQIQEAKNELKYILENIDRDPEVEKELTKLDNKT